jgi:hemolysin activation/secretion protein
MKTTYQKFAIALAMGMAAPAAWSAAAPPTPPASSGQLLQQVPQPATPQPSAPSISLTPPRERSAASTQSFLVEHIDVRGNSIVATGDIRKITASSEGKSLTLTELQKLADAISDIYHKRGYPFTQAYIPPQAITGGHVIIDVIEARYDVIDLRNHSRVRDQVVQAALSGLQSGQSVEQSSLDRALLLTSDLPSTEVKGTLRPGDTLGSSTLQVDVDPAPMINGSVAVDDYGNAATGRARVGGSVNLDNPLEFGDVLSASALTAGRGMTYGRIGYTLPLYGPATQLQANASTLRYKVVNGGERHLDSLGHATAYGASLQQSLWRSTAVNIVVNGGFEETRLGDEIDAADIHTDRHTNDWHLTLSGSVVDTSGVTNLSGGFTYGYVGFDDATARLVDESTANTAGYFFHYDLSLSRLQRIAEHTSLFAALNYQGSNKNLDISEQFFIGGPTSVRAYDNGFASGDQGDSETIELRQDLFTNDWSRWQGTLFFDHAQIQLEKDRYADISNTANAQGVGLGLNVVAIHGLTLTSAVATPVGGTPDVTDHRPNVRVWATLAWSF